MRYDDAELVRQTLAGDGDAFGELVKRYQGLVCGLAYHLVGNRADAEDLAQDAFLSAYENLKQLKDPSKFGAWLRQIAANFCRAYQQRHSYHARGVQLFDPTFSSPDAQQVAQIAAPDLLPDEIAEQKQREERIRQIVDSLSEKNRLTVVLFYMHDLSHREISDFLEIPVSAVKARLHKARKQLKERLLIMVENEFETMKPKAEFTERVMLAIRGRVVSVADGTPIADAKVILDYQTHTFTDASGDYRIELESGKMTERRLWIRAEGYPTYFEEFRTHAEEIQVVLDATLDPEMAASISGRLVTTDGKPVEGAEFWLRGREYGSSRLPDWPITDANGYFRYDGLRPSPYPYRLSTKVHGYLWKDLTLPINKPGHVDLGKIVLEQGRTISGCVTNPQGELVANASIHAGPGPYASVGDTRDAKTQTDADGRYTLCGVDWEEDGGAYVMVFAKGYGMASQKVKFGDAEKLGGVDFRLEAEAEIRGTVTDDKGKPIEGLRVMVYHLIFQDTDYCGRFGEYQAGETDAEGRFCIKGLPQGEGEIRHFWILDSDGKSVEPRASHEPIKIGTTDAQIVIKSPPEAQIAGTVVDADTGQPIPKFRIRLSRYLKDENLPDNHPNNVWGRWWNSQTYTYVSSDGRFTISNLSENEQQSLLVTADGYVATEVGPFEATRQSDASQLIIRLQRGKIIHGIVIDSESGEPISNAVVTYFSPTLPATYGEEILPQHISAGGFLPHPELTHRLPQGGEIVYTKKDGTYQITTAQEKDNYLLVTVPEYVPMVVGPIEVPDDELFLPISFTLKKKTQSLG